VQAQIGEQLLEPQPRKVLAALMKDVGDLVDRDEIEERAKADRAVATAIDASELGLVNLGDHLGELLPERGLRAGYDQAAVTRIRQPVQRGIGAARPIRL
jgi:hypothetical protein